MESIAYITSRKKQYDLKDIEARRTKLDKKDLPKNISSFLNDEGYVNKTVDDLINYYTKSETYTKEEVQELISTRILIKIVDELPESNISTSTIYFLKRPKEDLPQSQYQSDVYDEYIYVDATWELIGNTYVDLTPYYTKEEVEIVIDNKILEERLIRENAEFTLQNNINALEQKTDSEITQIKQINLNQDNSISNLETNLQNEITRATNKENELSDRSDNFDLHIENNENPHNVTKTQIGLSDVENLPIDDAPTLNSENYVRSSGVFNVLVNKVDKIEGKGLSDENFSYEEKTKLSNLKNYDDTEINNKVNQNTSAISILNSDSTVEGSVDNKIKNALLDVSGLQFNVVEELPTIGENGVIYFVLNTSISEGKNYYDEYIWINNKFELLGQTVTEIDLSNYHTKAEISALLSGKVDASNFSTTEWNAIKSGITSDLVAQIATNEKNINTILSTTNSLDWENAEEFNTCDYKIFINIDGETVQGVQGVEKTAPKNGVFIFKKSRVSYTWRNRNTTTTNDLKASLSLKRDGVEYNFCSYGDCGMQTFDTSYYNSEGNRINRVFALYKTPPFPNPIPCKKGDILKTVVENKWGGGDWTPLFIGTWYFVPYKEV